VARRAPAGVQEKGLPRAGRGRPDGEAPARGWPCGGRL